MKEAKSNLRQKLICLILYIPCLVSLTRTDNDIWFLLNSGRYVISKGIPITEPFTIHEGLSFVMQQWLSAVIFWRIYSVFGEIGLNILVVVLYALFVFIAFKFCMLVSEGKFKVSFVITLLVSLMMNPFMVERPHVFLFVIILSEIYFLEKYVCTNNNFFLISLPIVSVLLVNLEAAMWPVLFVVLIPYFIDSVKFRFKSFESQDYNIKSIFIGTLAMMISGMINPYGVKAMTYLFNSYGIAEINTWINEMKCADINSISGKLIFSSIFLASFSFYSYRKGKYRIRFYLLFLGTAYLALSSVRSFSLFIICGIIPMSFYFRNFKVKIEYKNDKKTLLIRRVLIVLLTAATVFLVIISNRNITDTYHQDLVSNVDYLETIADKNIKLYTGYNDGGYLEFRGYKVYMDPRAEVFLKSNNKKEDIFKEYYQFQKGEIYYRDVLNKYDFDYLLVDESDILYHYLDYDSSYKLIHSSSNYKIDNLLIGGYRN